MANRKYPKCQMCGGEFKNHEHHFAKYCKDCREKIDMQVKQHEEANVDPNEFKPFVLPEQFLEIRHKDISFGIVCPGCSHEIDVSQKTQDWEIKCDNCKYLFVVDLSVRVTKFA